MNIDIVFKKNFISTFLSLFSLVLLKCKNIFEILIWNQ